MAKKILVVLTSYGTIERKDGSKHPTGWYLPEFAHPYDVLVAAGYELTVVSPAGGLAPLDPGSVSAFAQDPSCTSFLANQKPLWENTGKLSSVAPTAAAEYDAIFYPGGHGPMFDLVGDEASQKLIAEFYAAGKPVAAVCHGPVVFVNVKLPDGERLVKGKTVTGFSNAEEDAAQMTQDMPLLLEDALKEAGATYVKADELFGEKVVVDGLVISGQNPASAKGVGEAIVKLLS